MTEYDELCDNAILAALPPDERDRIRERAVVSDVEIRHQVYRPRGPIEDVHFPLSAVFSLVAVSQDRIMIEVGTIGHEGMVGLPVFLGASSSPNAAFCQVAGRSARVPAADLSDLLRGDGALHQQLHRYAQVTMAQLAQSVLCNSVHAVEQRAARWLLTTADRLRREEFLLTQEFLGQMLGVRRTTVSETASKLQANALIEYTRGHITIVDREGLEQVACECYQVVRREFERMP